LHFLSRRSQRTIKRKGACGQQNADGASGQPKKEAPAAKITSAGQRSSSNKGKCGHKTRMEPPNYQKQTRMLPKDAGGASEPPKTNAHAAKKRWWSQQTTKHKGAYSQKTLAEPTNCQTQRRIQPKNAGGASGPPKQRRMLPKHADGPSSRTNIFAKSALAPHVYALLEVGFVVQGPKFPLIPKTTCSFGISTSIRRRKQTVVFTTMRPLEGERLLVTRPPKHL